MPFYCKALRKSRMFLALKSLWLSLVNQICPAPLANRLSTLDRISRPRRRPLLGSQRARRRGAGLGRGGHTWGPPRAIPPRSFRVRAPPLACDVTGVPGLRPGALRCRCCRAPRRGPCPSAASGSRCCGGSAPCWTAPRRARAGGTWRSGRGPTAGSGSGEARAERGATSPRPHFWWASEPQALPAPREGCLACALKPSRG